MGDGSAARSARLQAVIDDCRCRRLGGEVVSDDSLIAANPELMPELAEELRKMRLIAAASEQAAQPISSGVETRTHHGSDTGSGSGQLEVRCPICHAPTEVAVDTSLTDLTCSSCGSHFSLVDQSKATRTAPVLTKLGRFELIERVGIGGFGSVWKARDKELDRTVAIKIPRAGGMTAEEQEKFFREARAAAQLRHPSIVSVHEVGREGDSVYIVSDFVRGVTLGDWLTGQQLTSCEAAELGAKIADALYHAHQQGVVHRDLKPANIMIDGDTEPHLMDFGLARRETGEVTVTIEGQILGTPAYMSPEQAQGESHTADCRSDIYSLGVILFQLLTGELPFRGNARMLMHQVIHDESPSPRKFNSNVPKDLETIVLKCLEKVPDQRFQTARELAAELRRFLSGEPIHSRPLSRFVRAWRWARRRPAAALLLGVLAGIAVVGPIVAGQQVTLRRQSDAIVKQLDQRNAELHDQLTRNLFGRACAEYSGGRICEAIALLAAAYETASHDSPLRPACRNLMGGWSRSVGQLFLHDASVCAVTFSPDGRLAITGSDYQDGTARMWDCETGRPVGKPLNHGSSIWATEVSEDGSTLLTAGGRWVKLWDLRTGEPRSVPIAQSSAGAKWLETGYWIMDAALCPDGQKILTGATGSATEGEGFASAELWDAKTGKRCGGPMQHSNTVAAVDFSADGRHFATGSWNEMKLWDTETGNVHNTDFEDDQGTSALVFAPDGLEVIAAHGRVVRRWNTATGRLVGKALNYTASIRALALDSNGRKVLVGSDDRTAQMWDLESNERIEVGLQHAGPVRAVAFSPDGQRVLTGSVDRTCRLWDLRIDKPLREFRLHEKAIHAISYSADGLLLATGSADGTARVWRTDSVEPMCEPMRHEGSVSASIFGRDGRTLLTGSADKTFRRWDAKTGKPLSEPYIQQFFVHSVALSPDGQTVFLGGNRFAGVFDALTGKPLGDALSRESDVRAAAFSPDGSTVLAACSGGFARLWDVHTHELLHDFVHGSDWTYAAAICPDGRTLLTGGADSTARLWHAKSRRSFGDPMRHSDAVDVATFSLDGRVALTGSGDRTAQCWDARTGQPLGKPMRHDTAVTAAAFSPDNRIIAIGTGDGNVSFWKTPSELPDIPQLVAAWSRVRTGFILSEEGDLRRLTQDEWLESHEELEQRRGTLELP